ncbi:hypothetical protein DSO57_1025781 [Entomophthora muscae]|uniref:Uncharacterized protein n=1 Tax=Entomophthora muscae TaxID=34485 RepID=A0ACC2SEU9_9FUNG|nr:hypothetical protein DSO57_1025781 [Entomophthora muscae]
MNVSDAEILASVMNSSGYVQTLTLEHADIVFLVTCSIRDAAEQKIWHRLRALKNIQRPHHPKNLPPIVGVLGCMAERLKEKLLENDKLVDLVCGPDAYRSIPHLISLNETSTQGVANVILSADETYADIVPVRRDENTRSAFLSIMRGCNNMCSYCIVPFTRGTERSRPVDSIIEEVKRLSEQGIREVVLLGQNVNSYRDISNTASFEPKGFGGELSSPGFRTIYKRKDGGLRFAELVERVAQVDGEMRVRFTSPHPKDFPDALLEVIRKYPNVCNNLHLPAQSGSSAVLERMRRGYTREAYLDLARHVREVIPGVTFSSDFIAGFCGETESDHQDTITLMEEVQFDMAYMFAYSLREGTHAHRRMTDDVPNEVKQTRLREIIATFHAGATSRLAKLVGVPQLVLIDGPTLPKHQRAGKVLGGRTDGNHRAFLLKDPSVDPKLYTLKSGDYVVFLPTSSTSTSLTGIPLGVSTLQDFYSKGLTSEMKSCIAQAPHMPL